MVRHLTELKKIFGTITSQMANRICSIICDITPLLPDECLEFISKQASNSQTSSKMSPDSPRKLWGNHIQCNLPNECPSESDLAQLQNLPTHDPIINLKTIDKFSMKYDAAVGGSSSKSKSDIAKGLNRAWLLKHVNSELIPSFLSMLKSKKTNDELQNELIDMMGFDKFDVIQTIFDHRKQIVTNIETEDKKRNLLEKAAALESAGLRDKGVVPAVASQVVVHSEAELQLKKQVRRDEKRLKSLLNSDKNDDSDDCGDDIELDGSMRASTIQLQHQQNLLNAIQRQPILAKDRAEPLPLLHNPLLNSAPKIKYPFVYDEQIQAKSHVGFIAGSKLMLPDNVERSENRMYDEIKIPANDQPQCLGVGDVRVQTNELDEIGRMAFAGTKELNRIQSVVYPVAYHSNDNMLVCAPTGAGMFQLNFFPNTNSSDFSLSFCR